MKIKLMRKYSCLLSFLLAGIGAVSVSAPSKAQDANQNYWETITKATNAIYACHHERDSGECEKVYQIKTDLIGLCRQSNNAK